VGGTTIAQKLDTAGQPDMPASAIASGCIDFVLSPEISLKKLFALRTRLHQFSEFRMARDKGLWEILRSHAVPNLRQEVISMPRQVG